MFTYNSFHPNQLTYMGSNFEYKANSFEPAHLQAPGPDGESWTNCPCHRGSMTDVGPQTIKDKSNVSRSHLTTWFQSRNVSLWCYVTIWYKVVVIHNGHPIRFTTSA